ncbi:MAG: AAA family ATPase [Myxococcales bacterium]|nr:AAA family ATPase [Myxococcales bacterium]
MSVGELLADRYEVRRKLGAGGFGEVYEAYDRKRDERVAVKVLSSSDGAALEPDLLYRFKQEFRALADVSHRNLVALHELYADGALWFFSMELVDGRDFLSHVAGADPAQRFDEGRLRDALAQLVTGLTALHGAGKLHRDVKPSNVLVERGGRLALLDFGLVTEMARQSIDGRVMGTPEYLPPEQAAGSSLTSAADWYAVGVMLYQALTGRLPYAGALLQMLTDKQNRDATPPRAIARDVPADLDALCCALLAREPAARPAGDAIASALAARARLAVGSSSSSSAPLSSSSAAPPAESGIDVAPTRRQIPASARARVTPVQRAGGDVEQAAQLLGRDDELAELAAALKRVCDEGAPGVALVQGAAGVGKSALLEAFAASVEVRGSATVLRGACTERELLPYRALDMVIDGLSRELRQRPADELAALMPRHASTLARLFPVLARVSGIELAQGDTDELDLRRRAAEALRQLLGRLSDQRPLLIVIDDLQWGDLDSVTLLAEVLRPPDPPRALLVLAARSDAASGETVVQRSVALAGAAARTRVELSPLRRDDARALAERCLREALADAALAAAKDEQVALAARAIARESAGTPQLVAELSRHVVGEAALSRAGDDGPLSIDARALSLTDALGRRLEALPELARRVVTLLSVAQRPLPVSVLAGAAQVSPESLHALAPALRARHLVRSAAGEALQIESARVGAALLQSESEPSRRALHRALARAIEAAGDDALAQALFFHLEQAGEHERAAECVEQAARRAAAALAFDRAASLLSRAIELRRAAGTEPSHLRALRSERGRALANAGRGAEAADDLLAVASELSAAGDDEEALDLRRRAGLELVRSGDIDRGVPVLRDVLGAVGMSMPSKRTVLAALLWQRLRTRARGLSFVERSEAQCDPQALRRIDVCWAVGASGLGIVDTLSAAYFQMLNLRYALDVGEPYRIARALAGEIAYAAIRGTRGATRTQQLLLTARALAEEHENLHGLGMVEMGGGIAAYLEGRFRRGAELCERAEQLLRPRPETAFDVMSSQLFGLQALAFLGDLDALAAKVPQLSGWAEQRGSLYALTGLCTSPSRLFWFARDEVDALEQRIDAAMAKWSSVGFQVPHYWELCARCEIDIYRGEGERALARIDGKWSALSQLRNIQLVRVEAHWLRGRCALAAAGVGAAGQARRETLRQQARESAARIEREGAGWAQGLAFLLEAGAAETREQARALLSRAAAALEASEMSLLRAFARSMRTDLDAPQPVDGVADTVRLARVLVPMIGC